MGYCPKCGGETQTEAAFCMSCGEKLEKEDPKPLAKKLSQKESDFYQVPGWMMVTILILLAYLTLVTTITCVGFVAEASMDDDLLTAVTEESPVADSNQVRNTSPEPNTVPSIEATATALPNPTTEPTPEPTPEAIAVNGLAEEFGCQWIMDTFRPMLPIGRDTAIQHVANSMTIKANDVLRVIGSGDAATAVRHCEGQ